MASPCTLEFNIVEAEIETNCLEASICSRWIPEYMFSRTWSFQLGGYQCQLSLSLLQSIHLTTWYTFILFFKLHFKKERQTLPGLWLKPFSDVPMTLQTVQHLARRDVSLFWNVLFKNCRTSVIFLPSRLALLSWMSRHSSSTSWIPGQNITADTGLCLCLALAKLYDNDLLTNLRYCRGPWVCKSWERSIGSAGKAEVRNSRSWQGLEILSRAGLQTGAGHGAPCLAESPFVLLVEPKQLE